MSFNSDKCKIMHVGKLNSKSSYALNGKVLQEVGEEKDLGVIITSDFKVKDQCDSVANKGNKILGLIKRTFVSRNRKVMLQLYKALVRPHLDYCMSVWCPNLKKD